MGTRRAASGWLLHLSFWVRALTRGFEVWLFHLLRVRLDRSNKFCFLLQENKSPSFLIIREQLHPSQTASIHLRALLSSTPKRKHGRRDWPVSQASPTWWLCPYTRWWNFFYTIMTGLHQGLKNVYWLFIYSLWACHVGSRVQLVEVSSLLVP